MLDFLVRNQVYILISGAVFCAFLTVLTIFTSFRSRLKKKSLAGIELCTVIILIGDALCFIYKGASGGYAFWLLRIFEFTGFLAIILLLGFYNGYISSLIVGRNKLTHLPKRLIIVYALVAIGAILVVISPFTGLYYSIDSDNNYQRGVLYPLSMVIPFVVLAIQISVVVQYRKLIGIRLWPSMLIFSALPMAAGMFQLFNYGIPMIDISIYMTSVILFGCALADLDKELVYAANTELQTGLPNSFGFMHEVERIARMSDITQYDAYYIDIVKMSHVNNKFGKNKGDEVIFQFVYYLQEHLEKNEILGRFGGNYFCALIHTDRRELFLRMLSDIPIEIDVKGNKEHLHISAVAGVFHLDDKNFPLELIIEKTAMAISYAKKVAKKPYVILDDALEKEILRIRELEDELAEALEVGELEPFYQPKVNTDTNALCGAEALVRWRHEGKMIPPYMFVPILERSGDICQLDFYMLEHVCRDLREWLNRGMNPPTVSVNFSRKNLGNKQLAEQIHKVVMRYEIPENLIQVEVTETIDEYPMEVLKNVVEELRAYGFTTAIDDFGTGSSSISLLKDVAFDILKIDKAFIDYSNEKEKNLLGYIIQMSHAIGLNVIAEGVEMPEQIEALRMMGCNYVQGYVFDKPLEKIDYEKRLVNQRY